MKLELRDKHGKLLSENFYWHARDEHQLKQMNSMPQVELKGKFRSSKSAHGLTVKGRITNSGKTPAIAVRLTLRDAKTGERVLPVIYKDNYFSLLPGESKEFEIETSDAAHDVQVALDGWNITATNLGGK